MPAHQSAAFLKATEESRKLNSKPGNDDLLELYAYFKQGTQDPPIDQSPAPSMFDLKEKAKRNAWKKVADDGTTAEQAQEKYVSLVESLKTKHGFSG